MALHKTKKPGRGQTGERAFVSPLSDDIAQALFGDQKNIRTTEAFLKPIIRIPPGDYAGMRIVQPALFRRWRRDKKGVMDIKLTTKSGRTIHIEIQINPMRRR